MVFGGFGTASWRTDEGFFGTGESFVFKAPLQSAANGVSELLVWEWARGEEEDCHFQFCSDQGFGFGGDGAAIFIDSDLRYGRSVPSKTFGNDTSLCSQETFSVVR